MKAQAGFWERKGGCNQVRRNGRRGMGSEGLSWPLRSPSYHAFMFKSRETFLALYGQDTSTAVGQNGKHVKVSRGSTRALQQKTKIQTPEMAQQALVASIEKLSLIPRTPMVQGESRLS